MRGTHVQLRARGWRTIRWKREKLERALITIKCWRCASAIDTAGSTWTFRPLDLINCPGNLHWRKETAELYHNALCQSIASRREARNISLPRMQILIFVDKNAAQSPVVIVKIILSHRRPVIAVIIVTALVPGDSITSVHVNIVDITMQLPIIVLK